MNINLLVTSDELKDIPITYIVRVAEAISCQSYLTSAECPYLRVSALLFDSICLHDNLLALFSKCNTEPYRALQKQQRLKDILDWCDWRDICAKHDIMYSSDVFYVPIIKTDNVVSEWLRRREKMRDELKGIYFDDSEANFFVEKLVYDIEIEIDFLANVQHKIQHESLETF